MVVVSSVAGLQDYVPGWNGFSPAFLVQFFIDNPDLFEEFAVRIGSTIKVSQEALLRIWLRLSWAAARKRIATLPQAPAAYTEDVACLLRQLQFRQFGDELHCLPNTDQLIWHFRVVSWATEYAQLLDHRIVPIIEQVYQFVSERKGTGRVLIRRMSNTLAITAAGFKIVNDHIVHLGNGKSKSRVGTWRKQLQTGHLPAAAEQNSGNVPATAVIPPALIGPIKRARPGARKCQCTKAGCLTAKGCKCKSSGGCTARCKCDPNLCKQRLKGWDLFALCRKVSLETLTKAPHEGIIPAGADPMEVDASGGTTGGTGQSGIGENHDEDEDEHGDDGDNDDDNSGDDGDDDDDAGDGTDEGDRDADSQGDASGDRLEQEDLLSDDDNDDRTFDEDEFLRMLPKLAQLEAGEVD